MSAQAILITLAVAGGLAAAGFEIWMLMREHPKRWPLSYAAWTPVAMIAVAGANWNAGAGAALGGALLLGPILYPLIRGFIWLRFGEWEDHLSSYHDREREAELERLKVRATDFGGVATPRPAAADPAARPRQNAAAMSAPMAVAPARSALGRIVKPRRPRWAGPAEMVVVTIGCALAAVAIVGTIALNFIQGGGSSPYGYDMEAVAATLEDAGYAAPRVQPYGSVASCPGYVYRWRAVGAEGRACVDAYDGQVSAWVERRWPPMRPGGAQPEFKLAAPSP